MNFLIPLIVLRMEEYGETDLSTPFQKSNMLPPRVITISVHILYKI